MLAHPVYTKCELLPLQSYTKEGKLAGGKNKNNHHDRLSLAIRRCIVIMNPLHKNNSSFDQQKECWISTIFLNKVDLSTNENPRRVLFQYNLPKHYNIPSVIIYKASTHIVVKATNKRKNKKKEESMEKRRGNNESRLRNCIPFDQWLVTNADNWGVFVWESAIMVIYILRFIIVIMLYVCIWMVMATNFPQFCLQDCRTGLYLESINPNNRKIINFCAHYHLHWFHSLLTTPKYHII